MAANLQFRATNWAQTTCSSRRRCIPASLHSVVAPMPKAWACRAVALRAQSAATSDAHLGSSSGSTTLSQLEIIGIAIAAAAPAVMLAAGPAAAADVIDDGGLDAVDALDASYGALQAQSGGSTDLLVSILAAIVFVLLVVVTGGVAYLTLKSWLDERQEKDDRTGRSSTLVTSSSVATTPAEEAAPKRVRVKRDRSRGFGGDN